MSALNRIASVVLVGALVAMPAMVMAGGARNGQGGANAPATAVQQRDRTREHAQTATQTQDQVKLQKRTRTRTEDPAHEPAGTGNKTRSRKGG